MDNVFARPLSDDVLNDLQESELVEQILSGRRLSYGSPTSETLKRTRERGFNPIAITVMLCEETFVFDTTDEAIRCAEEFGYDGWYYELEEFLVSREKYVNENYNGNISAAPEVYWLI